MAYPPHGHQPPPSPYGPPPQQPGQGPQYGQQPPPPYGQPPPDAHSFPPPGQYGPNFMPPSGPPPRRVSTGLIVFIGCLVTVLVVTIGAMAIYLSFDESTSGSTSSEIDENVATEDSDGAPESHEARFTIGEAVDDAPSVVIFADYYCPSCQSFDYSYGEMLRAMALNGEINLDIVTLNLTGESSDSSDHGSQATAIAACVHHHAPEDFGDFHGEVMRSSHIETGDSLSVEAILDVATTIEPSEDIQTCVDSGEQEQHAETAVTYAQENGVGSVPTVWVDGETTSTDAVLDAIEAAS